MKDFQSIKKTIAGLCKDEPSIVAVYIFGSVAKGTSKKTSDLDVAVLLNETESEQFSILSFISLLEKKMSCRVDAVVLNRASEILKFEVRSKGKIVFDRSVDFRKKFEIMSRKTYEDFLYLHKRYVNSVLYGENNG